MLKFFFWLFLLANAALFAYQRGALEAIVSSGREPARMGNQLNADKVRILPVSAGAQEAGAAEPAASLVAASAPGAESAPAPVGKPDAKSEAGPDPRQETPPARPAAAEARPETKAETKPETRAETKAEPTSESKAEPAVAKVIDKKPDLAACLEVGNFNPEEAKRFSAQLTSSSLAERASERTVQEVVSHIVYIPPQADKDAADRKAGELRRLGINDFYIMPDSSPLRWGISLGVFRTEEAARAHLAALNAKGVRSARIGQRAVHANLVAYQFRNLEPEKKWLVEKIKSNFARQEVRACE
ncbi:SPOR domain-containing protein [Noviherbaspirillum galbum]|uniref:SPOR domain-containing protein n=1 Tax=Noviherbaspirillum galbum TaxID=2709383 RepID=A0A6B3SSG3_9BURK|nr:SPOR domain-containing protein [Noviherbaspirillum galbum]NEX61382.1 SPOR domain-containing protein [Noviherbaspirillum galbum]